jgi:hypothetical protein
MEAAASLLASKTNHFNGIFRDSPAPKATKLAPRAADTSQQFRNPRSKAQEQAGKQSAVDEAEFPRKVDRSDSNLVQLEPGGSCNVIIRRGLGVYGLSSTPTRLRLSDLTIVSKKTRRQKAALRDMHPVFVSSSR